VVPASPLVFDLPSGAQGTTLLEGSAPQAVAEGPRVTATGPFQIGSTPIHVAYQLPYSGSGLTVEQKLPALLQQLSLVVQTTPGMQVSSPQIETRRDESANGQTFLVAGGPAIPAGGALRVELSNLPHHSMVPRNIALALAALVFIVGGWAAFTKPSARERGSPDGLAARREALFTDLVRLERAWRNGAVEEEAYRHQRRRLMRNLEKVYDASGVSLPPDAPREAPRRMIRESA
jgi:hypothetical protein